MLIATCTGHLSPAELESEIVQQGLEGNRTAALEIMLSAEYNDTSAMVTDFIENLQLQVCLRDVECKPVCMFMATHPDGLDLCR